MRKRNEESEEFDELQLVESIRAKNIDFTQEDLYLTLLKKIETFLDAKFDEGYCASLHLTDNIESCYRASLENNKKHIEILKRLHQSVIIKYNEIISKNDNSDDITFNEMISEFKIVYNNLMELAKDANKLNPISEQHKNGVEIIDGLLFKKDTLTLLKEQHCFDKQLSVQIFKAIFESASYMRYLNSMLEVLVQEFPQTYTEIVTAEELDQLLQSNILNADSLMVGGSINNYIFSIKELIESTITQIEQSLKVVGVPIDRSNAKIGKTYKEFDIVRVNTPEISGEQILGLISKFNELNSLLANVVENGKNRAVKQRFWKLIEQYIQVTDGEYVLMSKDSKAKSIIAKHNTDKQYEDITSVKAVSKYPLESLHLDNATMLELIGEPLQKDYQSLISSHSEEERE